MGRGLEIQSFAALLILPNVKAAHNSESNFRLMPHYVSRKGPSWKEFQKCNSSFLSSKPQEGKLKGIEMGVEGATFHLLHYSTCTYTLHSIIKLLGDNDSNSVCLRNVM